MAKNKKQVKKSLSTEKELEEKAKYEEFWSDPCWTQPLETVTEFSTKALP